MLVLIPLRTYLSNYVSINFSHIHLSLFLYLVRLIPLSPSNFQYIRCQLQPTFLLLNFFSEHSVRVDCSKHLWCSMNVYLQPILQCIIYHPQMCLLIYLSTYLFTNLFHIFVAYLYIYLSSYLSLCA